uniref:Uncharacterized protein n=1 Tax=Panagrolaimus sp. ES5 TaxID=591445 RepID=A0AC34FZP8_9BILA
MKISVIAKITCASAKFVKNWDSVFTESDAQKVCFLNDLFNPAKKFIVGKLLIIDFTATLTIQDDVAPAEAKMLKIDKTLGNMLWESEADKDVSIVIDNENEIKVCYSLTLL